jgi:hypothetical protein
MARISTYGQRISPFRNAAACSAPLPCLAIMAALPCQQNMSSFEYRQQLGGVCGVLENTTLRRNVLSCALSTVHSICPVFKVHFTLLKYNSSPFLADAARSCSQRSQLICMLTFDELFRTHCSSNIKWDAARVSPVRFSAAPASCNPLLPSCSRGTWSASGEAPPLRKLAVPRLAA